MDVLVEFIADLVELGTTSEVPEIDLDVLAGYLQVLGAIVDTNGADILGDELARAVRDPKLGERDQDRPRRLEYLFLAIALDETALADSGSA